MGLLRLAPSCLSLVFATGILAYSSVEVGNWYNHSSCASITDAVNHLPPTFATPLIILPNCIKSSSLIVDTADAGTAVKTNRTGPLTSVRAHLLIDSFYFGPATPLSDITLSVSPSSFGSLSACWSTVFPSVIFWLSLIGVAALRSPIGVPDKVLILSMLVPVTPIMPRWPRSLFGRSESMLYLSCRVSSPWPWA